MTFFGLLPFLQIQIVAGGEGAPPGMVFHGNEPENRKS